MKYFILAILVLSAVHLQAQEKLDVNDVSYLWEPPTNNKEAKYLVSVRDVVTAPLFNQIIGVALGKENKGFKAPVTLPLKPFELSIDSWRVVSFRIDPCAPDANLIELNPSACMQEVRLVAQPFHIADFGTIYSDLALHILFELDRGEPSHSNSFARLFNSLRQLKNDLQQKGISTLGVPLRVHPGLKDKVFKEQLSQVLLTSLQEAKLKKVTFAGATSSAGPWLFYQGLVREGLYVLEQDKNLQNLPFGVISPALAKKGGHMAPAPSNQNWHAVKSEYFGPSAIDLFVHEEVDWDKKAKLGDSSLSEKIRVGDIIPAIDNPHFSNRANTDCFSCHTTTTRRLQLNPPQGSPYDFQSPGDETTDAVLERKSIANFRIFGWFGSTPVVNQRVINESALVVNYLNSL